MHNDDHNLADASTLVIKGACTWHESVKVTTDKAATSPGLPELNNQPLPV